MAKKKASEPDDADGDDHYVAHTKLGYPLDEVMSALQKCVRRGRTAEACFWTRELVESNFVKYFWRRLQVIASEEVGGDLATCALVGCLAANAERATKGFSGRIEGIIETQAIIALCRAPKSREAVDAAGYMYFARKSGLRIQPVDCAVDMHTHRGREKGRKFRDFRKEGRLLAGDLKQDDKTDPTRNDFERLLWGERQPHLGLPGEDGAESDIELPPLEFADPDDPNAVPELPSWWSERQVATKRQDPDEPR